MAAARRSGAVLSAPIAVALVLGGSGCASSAPPDADPRVNYLSAICTTRDPLAAATRALTGPHHLADIRRTSAAARDALLDSEHHLAEREWPAPIMADVAVLRAGELDHAQWFDQAATADSLGVVAFHWNPSPDADARRADQRIRRWLGLSLDGGCGAP